MNFSVFITNYKAWPVTLETVLAVLEFGGDQLSEVLIVDDCSDAPSEWSGDNRVRIHRNSNNQGYVRSVNIGVSLLKEELIVMFDCDARPLTPFAGTVQEAFTNDAKLGVLGFTQTDDSGVLRPSGEGGPSALEFVIGPAFWSRLPSKLRHFLSPPASYLCIHSCCFAFRKKAFDQINGFDESFDFLDADMDFSISLNRAGWKSAITDKVICFHPGGGSPQSTTTRALRLHRNRWQLLRKHGLVMHEAFSRIGLILRHSIELLSLYSLGVCLPSKRHNLREKIECRKQLLKTANNNYLL
jgi:GT2 family glycosyltransferase